MPKAVNHVEYGGNTLIDLRNDTVTSAEHIMAGYYGHLANGNRVLGTGQGGGGSTDEGVPTPLNDVVFVDYDGTILYEYSKAEFLALTAMPANPSHTGLTAQGWNWTLSDAKTYVTSYGTLCIGQSYTTADGKTRFYYTVTDLMLGKATNVCFTATVKGGVTVNWGDGSSSTSTANANAISTLSHTYAATGNYVITLEVTSGTAQLGGNASNKGVFYSNGAATKLTLLGLTKVEVGDKITQIHRNAFSYHTNLKTVSLPTTVTAICSGASGEVFLQTGLKCLVIPSGVTAMGPNTFSYDTDLEFIAFPKGITSFPNNAITNQPYMPSLRMITTGPLTAVGTSSNTIINNARRLERFSIPGTYTTIYGGYCREAWLVKKLTIPASVTSIADYAFTNCANLRELHMLPTSPPSLGNARAITNTGSLIIYVPSGKLSAYQSANGWSSFASIMQEES